VQALLFIGLCRCAGIPAKWQSGKYVTPESTGNHDWAMFYIEPWGWLFADCSFGGSAYRAGVKERHDFYFGNLDPFRMAANNALLKEFTPAKKHWRIDPYDNQSGEAEYENRGLRRDELISECEVLEMKKVL
jgi:transglutaminase-like putative cysteine protease